VVPGVFVASAVSEPHIVALVSQHEPWRLVLIVDEPSIGTVEESVLQENRFESFFDNRSLSLDAEDGQNIAVICNNLVGLHRVVVVLAIVGEGELGFRVGTPGEDQERKKDYPDTH
jgi:hypothetical protein